MPAGIVFSALTILPHSPVTYRPLGVLPAVPDAIALQFPVDPPQGRLHPSDLQRGAGFIE